MKKILYSFLGLVLVSQMTHAADQPAGKIVLVKGQVFIVDGSGKVVADPEGKRGRSTLANQPFYVGETLQTKGDGRVKLLFVEGANEVVLGANTSLFIERASTDPAKKTGTSLGLARGEVRSEVKTKYSGQGQDVYEIKTSNAVAGVRGTIFDMKFDGKNVGLATSRGAVSFAPIGNPGAAVMVLKGMASEMKGFNTAPVKPIPIERSSMAGVTKSFNSGSGESKENDKSESAGEKPGAKNDEKSGDKADKKEAAPAQADAGDKSADKKDDKQAANGDNKSSDNGDKKSDGKGDVSSTKKGDGSAPPTGGAAAPGDAPGATSGSASTSGSGDRSPASTGPANASAGPAAGSDLAPPPPVIGSGGSNGSAGGPPSLAPPPIVNMPTGNNSFSSVINGVINNATTNARQSQTNAAQTIGQKANVTIKIQ